MFKLTGHEIPGLLTNSQLTSQSNGGVQIQKLEGFFLLLGFFFEMLGLFWLLESFCGPFPFSCLVRLGKEWENHSFMCTNGYDL